MNVFNQISGRENSSRAALRLPGVWNAFDNGSATIGRPIVVGMDTHRCPMSWCSSIMQMTPSVERGVCVCAVLVPPLSLFASHVNGDGRIWWAGLFLLHRSLLKICPLEGELRRQEETNTRLHGKDVDIFYSLSGLLFLFSDDVVKRMPPKKQTSNIDGLVNSYCSCRFKYSAQIFESHLL